MRKISATTGSVSQKMAFAAPSAASAFPWTAARYNFAFLPVGSRRRKAIQFASYRCIPCSPWFQERNTPSIRFLFDHLDRFPRIGSYTFFTEHRTANLRVSTECRPAPVKSPHALHWKIASASGCRRRRARSLEASVRNNTGNVLPVFQVRRSEDGLEMFFFLADEETKGDVHEKRYRQGEGIFWDHAGDRRAACRE